MAAFSPRYKVYYRLEIQRLLHQFNVRINHNVHINGNNNHLRSRRWGRTNWVGGGVAIKGGGGVQCWGAGKAGVLQGGQPVTVVHRVGQQSSSYHNKKANGIPTGCCMGKGGGVISMSLSGSASSLPRSLHNNNAVAAW